jgi:protein-S-isoprenylcysteine O-methyltransferase Ste14
MNTRVAYLIVSVSYFIGGGSLIAFAVFLYSGSCNLVGLGLDENSVLLFDAGLSVLFFIQHSFMIRRSFRKRVVRFIPEECYSPLYAVVSGMVLLAVVVLWQESNRTIAVFQGIPGGVFRLLYLAALAGFVWGTQALKSFDALGVRQVMNRVRGRTQRQMPFTVSGPYRWVRHPLYFFVLLMIWSCPALTMDRLLFNVLWTIWIIVGAFLEERDLVADFGDRYVEYQKKVPMLIPYKLRPARQYYDDP